MKAEITIIGAGIAGVSAAYSLMEAGVSDILLIDERDPLSLTSDKSSECYRNWWPGPDEAMITFMNRSIDLMEMLALINGNAFQMNRRGYLYLTADPTRAEQWKREAEQASRQGAGPLRIHTGAKSDPEYLPTSPDGFQGFPEGADLILDTDLLNRTYPYLADGLVAGLHVRRAGWLSAQQLGQILLKRGLEGSVRFIRGRVQGIDIRGNQVQTVYLQGGEQIQTACVIDAAGPFLSQIGQMLGVELPVQCELHQKAGFRDTLGIITRDAPLLICADSQRLDWTEEERQLLSEDEASRYLLGELPSGAHTRPDGGSDSPVVLLLWEAQQGYTQPMIPPALDPSYSEIALRGLARIVPGFARYLGHLTHPVVDGGYYVKTPENRPLIGPLPVKGAYVYGALSGFGIMAACAGGELLAAHITGNNLPAYAPAFNPNRYENKAYQEKLANWGEDYQL